MVECVPFQQQNKKPAKDGGGSSGTTNTSATTAQAPAATPSSQSLRIVSLIPSATDIYVHLGLGKHVVGITHCCDNNNDEDVLPPDVSVVTRDMVHASTISQADIHTRVVANGEEAEAATATITTDEIPTLYPIDRDLLRKVNPTLMVTQDLCHVCAPSPRTVFRAFSEAGIGTSVVLLTPMNLWDVVTNLQQMADAAGIPEPETSRNYHPEPQRQTQTHTTNATNTNTHHHPPETEDAGHGVGRPADLRGALDP